MLVMSREKIHLYFFINKKSMFEVRANEDELLMSNSCGLDDERLNYLIVLRQWVLPASIKLRLSLALLLLLPR
jgi:hypothetical protein